ncbi:MAG: FecR family protein [Pseudomonadota bacterium]
MMRHDSFLASWLFAIFSLLLAGAALADGVLLSATGTVHVQKVFGGSKIVGPGATLKAGETISVEKGGTAHIRFTDGSELVLKPGTRVKLDKYNYVESQPENDAIAYSLVQGGLRAISGAIGKRGNPDAYQAKTPAGTIGIRGTQFIIISCEGGCPELLEGLPPEIAAQVKAGSVFFGVTEGSIQVSNAGGSGVFAAGQWGLMPAAGMPPIPIPPTPQIQKAFQASSSLGTLGVSRNANCKVR